MTSDDSRELPKVQQAKPMNQIHGLFLHIIAPQNLDHCDVRLTQVLIACHTSTTS